MSYQLLEKYDVAVSYLTEDEDLAYSIYTELGEVLKVFIYTQHQKKLTGKGGVETFRNIFINRTNLIIILYRKGWGESGWTSTEERAILDFGLENQWNGILLVNLDASKTPQWFPNSEIYLDYEQYGFEELIGIIKARAQERGSEFREITAIEKAEILQIRHKYENTKREFLNSEEGVREAQKEVKSLFEEIERICEKITSGPVKFKYEKNSEVSFYLRGVRHDHETGDYSLEVIVQWSQMYGNTLNGSKLIIAKVDMGRTLGGIQIDAAEPNTEKLFFDFDVTPTMENRWRSNENNKLFTSSKLADDIVKIIIEFKSS